MKLQVLTTTSLEDDSILLLVRLIGDAQAAAERRPVNLSLLIDRSSSMRGPRLKQAVCAAQELLGRLGPKDRLSIIAFDAAPTVLCPPGPVTEARRHQMQEELAKLTTGVGTNLAAAVRKGSDQIRASFVRNSISRVLLLTDGQASVGITDRQRLGELSEEICGSGVTITTMGLGLGFDDDILMHMAQSGKGSYYFLARPEDIPVAFGRELEGVFAIAAQDTQLRLIPHEDIESVEILHSLPSEPTPDGLLVHIGDVSSVAPRQVLFRMRSSLQSTATSGGRIFVTCQEADDKRSDAAISGIPLGRESEEEAQQVIAEELGLQVAKAVDRAWARRSSGTSGHALIALREVHKLVELATGQNRCSQPVSRALLANLAQAEIAIREGVAEQEQARRGMREKSQMMRLGHSVLSNLPEKD